MNKVGQTTGRRTREKVAAQRAAAARARKRGRLLIAGAGIAFVVVLVVVLAVVRPGSGTTPPAGPITGTAGQAAAVASEVASVPAGVFDAVGAGTATGLTAISGQPPLTSGGKPEVLYMGGEYCPYCAAERWVLTAALSRFGTFTGLNLIHSSPTDLYIPTLSFYKSGYTSKYLTFTPVEWFGEADDASSPFGHVTLQNPTPEQTALFTKYGGGSIPFIDIANQYLVPQAQYSPLALQGMTWDQVAAAMRTPSSPIAQDIDGAANALTAAICKVTNGQPAGVCTSAGVTAAAASLQSQGS
jgi:hypothetical protein